MKCSWTIAFIAALMSSGTAVAQLPGTPATPNVVNFNGDAPGAPPTSLEPVVGDWYVAELGGERGLLVDGSKWRQGVPSANLADQARRLYGERYAEFLDGVKAFAYFPLAVWQGECSGENVTLSVRFYPQQGRIDQAAGIAWSVAPDGSMFAFRTGQDRTASSCGG